MLTINVKNTSPNGVGSGARGDGVTNDAIAIQKHIDYLRDAGGGTLHFPAGRYLIATTGAGSGEILRLYSQITLTGEDGRSVLVLGRSQPKSTQMIFAEAAVSLRILSLTFDGQEHLQRTGPDGARRTDNDYEHQNAIFLQGCRDVLISNCRFQGIGGDALRARLMFDRDRWKLTPTRRLQVARCTFVNNRRVSVNFDGAVESEINSCSFRSEYSAADITTIENICRRSGLTASQMTNQIDIELATGPRPFTSHCFKMELDDSAGGPSGILFGNKFLNNHILDCAGISVATSVDWAISTRRLEISNNLFEFTDPYVGLFTNFLGIFNPGHPISLVNLENVLISGNRIFRPRETAGIRAAGCDLVRVIGNTITNPLTRSTPDTLDHQGVIQITGNPTGSTYRRFGGRSLIADNVITSATVTNRTGIVIEDSAGGRISGNRVDGLGTGIYFRNSTQGILVCGNTLRNNRQYGVLFNAGAGTNLANNRILGNRLESNGIAGVFCAGGTPLGFGIEVIENCFFRNGPSGNRVGLWHQGSGLIVEDNNFWGCPDGPDAAGDCNKITTAGGPGEPTGYVYRGSMRILHECSPRPCPDLSEDLDDLD